MMNNVKNIFSIRDLENLSGIKAHTIRIWEKRYKVLKPMRTDSNIRFYDEANLQKLLNITLLHNHGYKISKIATYSDDRIPGLVRDIISEKSVKSHAINAFKIAMMNFDQALFFATYNKLLTEKSFTNVFNEVFIPLLNEIGLLWQSQTITPAHEHFISHLIRQKVLTQTEVVKPITSVKTDKVFVLFLPENEIHELGLMYLNYQILLHGYKCVYLGASIPLVNLREISKFFENIIYVSYFTVKPLNGDMQEYVRKIQEQLLQPGMEFWVLGKMSQYIPIQPEDSQILTFTSLHDVVAMLK
ncbi:MAG TPA: MerR family transcriptional regulator [Flavobacterium sp.]|jgi:DNA-binding transcriptional MerR regulator|nr:MerR family transcriptional regulator [Flavobacterium sp.]